MSFVLFLIIGLLVILALVGFFGSRIELVISRHRMEHAARAGDARSMNSLGVLLDQRGDETEAETWYRQAAHAGNNNAMLNLATFLLERGDVIEGGTWRRKAAKAANQQRRRRGRMSATRSFDSEDRIDGG